MSDLTALAGRDLRPASPKAVPPPVHPHRDHWPARAVTVGLVGLLIVAASMLISQLRPWLPAVVVAICLVVAAVVFIGTRTNRRRELVAVLATQMQNVLGFEIHIGRVRWRCLWAAAPARMTLRYPERIGATGSPSRIAEQLAAACSKMIDTPYAPGRHTARCRLTLVRQPRTEPVEVDEVRERIQEVVKLLMGKDATVGSFANDDTRQIIAFTVRHTAGVKLANQLFQTKVTRIMSAMLPGKWRAKFDLESDEAHFRLRPPLPTFISRPVLPCEPGTPAYFELPQAIDEDGNTQVWDISGPMAHVLKVGRTRSGKTVSLLGDAMEAARRGFRVFVIDPKRVEFLGMRGWPNVEVIATTVPDQIAVIHYALDLMNERYRQVEEEGVREVDFERVLLIIDEYRQFYANVKGWWASIKVTGMPAECPVLEWVGSLLRMAGACGIHVNLGTQRPDAEFLGGEALAVDTPIPTPTGWTTMHEVEVDDHLLDETGHAVRVTATTAVMYDRPCYRVTFSDGSRITADHNHLWAAYDAPQRSSDTTAKKSLTRSERYPHHTELAHQLTKLPQGERLITVAELEAELGGLRIWTLRRGLHDGRWPTIHPNEAQPAAGGRFSARTYQRSELIAALHSELISPAPTWRRAGPRIVTTAHLASTLHAGAGNNWSIPAAPAPDLPAADLPVDPWLLGYWLGDGSRGAATIATADDEVLQRIRDLGYRVTHYARYNYGISTGPRGGWNRASLQRSLRQMGLLYNKHVPPTYLRGSIHQRAELLAGLLDSDGTCALRGHGASRSAQVIFVNTNRRLIEAVHELAASLGFIPTITQSRRAGREACASSVAFGRPVKDAWAVRFTTDRQVFGIGRKQQKLAPALAPATPKPQNRYIVNVEPVESVPVRCITVESENHLYLAGRSFVATHNCRDNFSARMSTGRLSPQGAQMMYDTQHVGTSVPLNVRGRATMIGVDDVPREVQVFYTPDPRRAASPEDIQLLQDLKPVSVTHPRRRVVLGDADMAREQAAAAEEVGGKKPKKAQATSDEWLEVLNAKLVVWAEDAAEAGDTVLDDVTEDEFPDDNEDEDETDDQFVGYAPVETIKARRVQADMVLQLDEDRWVCVTAVDTTDDDEAETQVIAWLDDDDNEGVVEIGSFDSVEVRRPTATSS